MLILSSVCCDFFATLRQPGLRLECAVDASQDEHVNELTLAACTPREAKAPALAGAFLTIGSLTMTYFHTGIRTIIGAESFHCPVRDGKEWDQLAMVIRLKRFLTWCVYNANQISQFAESINVSASILIASRREHHALRDTHRPNVFRFKQSDRRRY